MFDGSPFDLAAYLARIGYDGPLTADGDTLAAIARLHPAAIPFENLNALLRRPVPLDIASLEQKLVRERRGGWCFEHNVLLGTALTAIGFHVEGLSARVLLNAPAGVVRPRSHMVLHVDLDGHPFIVDAGFGGLTLTGPLKLETGVEQVTPHEPFRLLADRDHFVVEARIRDDWKALYQFDLQRQALSDYEVSSWYLTTNPRSHFTTTLVAARAQADRRYALSNTELAIHHRDGYTERRALLSASELRQALQELFGIDVPAGDDVDAAFARLIESTASPAIR
jgi:N-hydroxyarylamine O-acetyltransferase